MKNEDWSWKFIYKILMFKVCELQLHYFSLKVLYVQAKR
jgi:hypothetical protein